MRHVRKHNVMTDERPSLLFINRSYWPDVEATGQLLTELCEDLSNRFRISVVAGRPTVHHDGPRILPRTENRNGVHVRRVRQTQFDKSNLLGRICNLLTYLISATWAAWWRSPPDVVVVETDPPLLACLGAILRRRYRCPLVLYLQDLYPDIAVGVGKLNAHGLLARTLRWLLYAAYRSADRVVVLSEDMQQRLLAIGVRQDRLYIVNNWADASSIYPIKTDNSFRSAHAPRTSFLVMYSGNLGLTQRLDEVLEAAELLRAYADIRFLFVGGGADRRRLQRMVSEKHLANITFVDYQAKSRLAESLSAANIQLVPLMADLTGCLMPSKFYGVLASGTPVLAVAPKTCELARVIKAEQVGVVCRPGHPHELARQLQMLSRAPHRIEEMGRKARALCLRAYDRPQATNRFGCIIERLLSHELDTAGTEVPGPATKDDVLAA